MGWKKYDTSTLDSLDLMRIESMKKYINSLNLNKPFLYKDLPQAYTPVDPDHPELGNVQARAGIDQGKSNIYTVRHTDGTQSRVWSSGVHCAGGQHQSPDPERLLSNPPSPRRPWTVCYRLVRL